MLDYIEANLEGDLTLDRMASIACLSKYHFARALKQAVGQSPHCYVGSRRLEETVAMIWRRSARPLAQRVRPSRVSKGSIIRDGFRGRPAAAGKFAV